MEIYNNTEKDILTGSLLSVTVQYSVHSGGREVLIRIVYYIITRDNVEVTDLC